MKNQAESSRGRARISKDQTLRKNQVHFCCSDSELAALNSAVEKSGLSRTEFILRATVNHNPKCKFDVESASNTVKILENILTELRYNGRNLNQIARSLNLAKVTDKSELKEEKLNSAIEKISKLRADRFVLIDELNEIQHLILGRK